MTNLSDPIYTDEAAARAHLEAIVTSNVSQSTLGDWIKALIQFRPTPPNLAAEILDALNQVDELRAERNVLVHGLWGTNCPPGAALVQTTRIERSEIIRDRVVTTADLDEFIDLALSVQARLLAILRAQGYPAVHFGHSEA